MDWAIRQKYGGIVGFFHLLRLQIPAINETLFMEQRLVIEREMLRLAEARSPASLCPSEVARACATDPGEQSWRELMPLVREVAAELADTGGIEATQGGEAVDVRTAKGPIRLRVPGMRGAYPP